MEHRVASRCAAWALPDEATSHRTVQKSPLHTGSPGPHSVVAAHGCVQRRPPLIASQDAPWGAQSSAVVQLPAASTASQVVRSSRMPQYSSALAPEIEGRLMSVAKPFTHGSTARLLRQRPPCEAASNVSSTQPWPSMHSESASQGRQLLTEPRPRFPQLRSGRQAVPGQSASPKHATHSRASGSHKGVAPTHSESSWLVHWTHRPRSASQTGR